MSDTSAQGTSTDNTSLTSIAHLAHVVAFGQMVRNRTKTLVLNEKIRPKDLPLKDGKEEDVRNAYAFADYITAKPRPEGWPEIKTEDAVQWYLGHDVPRNNMHYLLLLDTLQISPANGAWKLNKAGLPIHTKSNGKAFGEEDIAAYKGTDKPFLSMASKLYDWRQSHLDALAAGKPVVEYDVPARPAPTPVVQPKPIVMRKGKGGGNALAQYDDRHTGPRAHDPYTQGDYRTFSPLYTQDGRPQNPAGETKLLDIAARTENFHEYLRVTRMLKGFTIEKLEKVEGIGHNVDGWEIRGEFPKLYNLSVLKDALFPTPMMLNSGEDAGEKLVRLFVKGKTNNANHALAASNHTAFAADLMELPKEYWIDAMRKASDPKGWSTIPQSKRHVWHDSVIDLKTRSDYVKSIRYSIPHPEYPIDEATPERVRLTPANTELDFAAIAGRVGITFPHSSIENLENHGHRIEDNTKPYVELKQMLTHFNAAHPDTSFARAYNVDAMDRLATSLWADRAKAANGQGTGTNGRGGGS